MQASLIITLTGDDSVAQARAAASQLLGNPAALASAPCTSKTETPDLTFTFDLTPPAGDSAGTG